MYKDLEKQLEQSETIRDKAISLMNDIIKLMNRQRECYYELEREYDLLSSFTFSALGSSDEIHAEWEQYKKDE